MASKGRPNADSSAGKVPDSRAAGSRLEAVCTTRGCSETGVLTGWQTHPPAVTQAASAESADGSQQLWQSERSAQHPLPQPSRPEALGAQPQAAAGDHAPNNNATAATKAGNCNRLERTERMSDVCLAS